MCSNLMIVKNEKKHQDKSECTGFEGKTFDIIDMDSHQDFNRNVKKITTTFGIFEMLKFTFPIHAISHIHLTKNNNIEKYIANNKMINIDQRS